MAIWACVEYSIFGINIHPWRKGEVAGLRVEHAGREEEIKRRKVVNKAVVERVMLRYED